MSGLTSDYQGDNLHLQAHLSGDPTRNAPSLAAPSGMVAYGGLLGIVGLLAVLWFVFKTVRV